MSRLLSRLLSQFLPLTHLRFGSRKSLRPINRLREVIPQHVFRRYFREYRSYAALATSLSSVCEDQRKVPNRWQAELPRIKLIRKLVTECIEKAEQLLEVHGYIDGLKEYVVTHQIHSWENEQHTGGILYLHELQYFHALRQFFLLEDYAHFAPPIQRLLQGAFEYPNELWTLVYAVCEYIAPPSYEYELDCNFEPRQDEIANRKRAYIEEYGSLAAFLV